LTVEKGQKVQKGALLARLEDDLLRAAAKEAEASLNISKLNLNNQKRLFEEQAAAESAYLQSQYQLDIAQARYDIAQARLARTVIRAPISGVVDTRELEEGELASATRPFMDIVDIDRVRVVAGVPERHLRHVQINTNVTITFPAYPNMTQEGRISFIGTTIDPDNRTVPVEIILSNPEHLLKPEMASVIRVVRDHIPEAIVIPQDAVVDTDQGMMVFTAAGSVARAVPVTLGPLSQDQVVVLEGIQAGMALITVGHRDLVDGEPIRIRNDR
jgi:RND family efflux transporter MFP subunit